jgi:hypothetical protein
MIVERIGYKKICDLEDLKHFSIYETNKKTNILILDTSISQGYLYYPKYDRLPWKIIEGKKICINKKDI